MKPVILILDDERPISWNRYYSGKHWAYRKAEADRVHMLVRSAIDPNCHLFECQVDIEIRAYFDKRPQDASNICAKLYEDGLIGWIIKDDSPAFVRSMKTVSLMDKADPRVEIEVSPVKEG